MRTLIMREVTEDEKERIRAKLLDGSVDPEYGDLTQFGKELELHPRK